MDKKELSVSEFDLKTHFIDYWDEVVRQWLENDADYSKFKDQAKEQSQIIKAINDMFGVKPEYRLNTIHMPEPYWGDPTDCSIVLLDYNPAGGPRVNRHTTISCKSCTGCESLSDKDKDVIPSMTFIKYVDEKIKEGEQGYSSIALTGPVFKAKKGLDWFWDEDNGYEGYGWWQQKCGWLDHLVEVTCGKEGNEEKLPFAMELCGWHSQKWNNDMSWIDNGQCRTIINNRSILPLFAAMRDSSCKMAVCIGAEFRIDWLEQFFKNKIKDVTKALSDKIMENVELKKSHDIVDKDGKVIFADLTYTVKYDGKENIHVDAKWNVIKKKGKGRADSVNRNYRVFKITEGNESYYLLNTNYRGSNGHPAEHFWKFEELLINEIKNLDKPCKTGVNILKGRS